MTAMILHYSDSSHFLKLMGRESQKLSHGIHGHIKLSCTFNAIEFFHDKIKFDILRQNLHQACFNDFSNVKCCMKKKNFSLRCAKHHKLLWPFWISIQP